MTKETAFEIIHNFHHHADSEVIEAINYLCPRHYAKELSAIERSDFSSSLIAIKWGYPGIFISAAEATRYLNTHPGFLADVILWAGWQFVVDAREEAAR